MLSEHTLTHMLFHDPCLSRSCLSLFSTTSWVRSDTRQTPPPLEFLFRWSHPLYLYPSWRTVFLAFTHRPKDQTFVGEIKHVQFCHDEHNILHMTYTTYNTWCVVTYTTYCCRPRVRSEDHVGWTTLGSQQTHWNRRPSHTNKFVTRWVANRPRMPITRPRDFGSSI